MGKRMHSVLKSGRCRLSLLSVALVLLLQACTGHIHKVKAPAEFATQLSAVERHWLQHSQAVRDLADWHLKGRMGIITDNDSGAVSLNWQQQADAYAIRVTAAFGRVHIMIEGDKDGVSFRNKTQEALSASSPEELIWLQTGWYIPVSDLQYWVLGLPAAPTLLDAQLQRAQDNGAPILPDNVQLDTAGYLSEVRSKGWHVQYLSYRFVDELQLMLPRKMLLSNGELQIKIAIKDWSNVSTES